MFIILTAVVAATGGYAAARRGAPKRSELEALKRELDAAHKQADDVQSSVTSHFEQSAVLFGQLARDYRAFLQHFSESARDLGISEARARELLERADRPLLAKSSEIIDADTGAADVAGADGTAGARTAGEPQAAAATPAAAAVDSDSAPTMVAAEGTQATADASAGVAEATALDAAARAPAADVADVPEIPEATEGAATPEPEPPLIDDVVKPGRVAPSADADAGTVASRVVDVDLDALGLPVPEEEQPGSDGGDGAGSEPSRKRADGA
jgi:uncharacterized membrane-anchored protein YhcB (DUF1043 family)